MEALLASGYPVGFTVVAISITALVFLGALAFLGARAPQIITPPLVISLFMMLTFVVVVLFSTLKSLPDSKTGELLLGALISTFTTVIVYWFGQGRGPDEPP